MGLGSAGCKETINRQACEVSEQCDFEAGSVCIQGLCEACVSDDECRLDSAFGVGSRCQAGACCVPGTEACGCLTDGDCERGFRCAGDVCEVCPPGEPGCPCNVPGEGRGEEGRAEEGEGDEGPGPICSDPKSRCIVDTCQVLDCTDGAAEPGCPCVDDDVEPDGAGDETGLVAGRCAPGTRCGDGVAGAGGAVGGADEVCEVCAAGSLACVCERDGGCDESLTCINGGCRPCEDGRLGCECDLADDGDRDHCLAPYWCKAGRCVDDLRSCVDLEAECLEQGRRCEGEPRAQCTTCKSPEFVSDGLGGCEPASEVCPEVCPGDTFCLSLSQETAPSCVPAPCGDAAAWHPRLEECVPCGGACPDDATTTGRLWPTTTNDGLCVCETRPGHYFDAAYNALAARPCDEDGDGWVRNTARAFVDSGDAALRENARCDVLSIDRVVLRNELGQERQLLGADDPTLGFRDQLDLYEPVVLDSAAAVDDDEISRPAYGARAFSPAELNPLTKACATELADFNANGVPDVQENALSVVDEQWLRPFAQLSYFAELHRGWVAPAAAAGAGRPDPAGWSSRSASAAPTASRWATTWPSRRTRRLTGASACGGGPPATTPPSRGPAMTLAAGRPATAARARAMPRRPS